MQVYRYSLFPNAREVIQIQLAAQTAQTEYINSRPPSAFHGSGMMPLSSAALWASTMSGTGSTFLTTLAGEPMATEKSGTSLVTTLPAATVHPLPMVTPGTFEDESQ